ncbi:hypothetical protein ACLKA6_000182 [Drosophila palustris]
MAPITKRMRENSNETLDLQDEFGWCRQSIVDWKSYLREVYIDWSQRNSRVRIGGPGKIVEIDEAKNFVDPETRAHTQNIERLWRDMRGDVPRFGRSMKHSVGYLARFEFRKKLKSIKERRHELFMAIGRLYDPNRDPNVAGDAQGCSDDDDDDVDDVDDDDYDDDDDV